MTKKDIKKIVNAIKKIYKEMDRNVSIRLCKKIREEGLFTLPTYDYKTVNSWDKMIEAEKEGWGMQNQVNYSINLAQKNRIAIETLLEVLEKNSERVDRKKKK